RPAWRHPAARVPAGAGGASSQGRSRDRRSPQPTPRLRPRSASRPRPDESSECAPCWPRPGESQPRVQNSRRMTGHSRALLAEGAGAFMFFFIGAGAIVATNGEDLVAVALAHGLALAVVVPSFGALSGGHFNPAVTFGLAVAGKHPWTRVLTYGVAQIRGALAASFA